MHLGLGLRELAAPDELGDERVVVGELLEPAVAEDVGARVADVADRDRPVLAEERDRHRRSHARGAGVVECALVDAPVRLLDELDHLGLAAGLVVAPLAQRSRGERGGDLAGLRAAHPVGDREERRVADERILVAAALPAGVALAVTLADREPQRRRAHRSNLRSVSPTRTTSPGTSLRSRASRIPLTKVPFVEPASAT